jgi:PAP2 superfamily protein
VRGDDGAGGGDGGRAAVSGAGHRTAVAVLAAPEGARPRVLAPRWWREVLYILAFYAVYTAIRDTQGSAGRGQTAPSATAFRHARDVIRIEHDLVLFHEQQIQHFFLVNLSSVTSRFFQFWNLWYGSAHFVVTAAVVIWLFRRRSDHYAYWRNALAITTGLALVGFSVFPLMPPRLLPFQPYGFVDTLARYGGSWSFDSGAMNKVSNQFAAMPSLHIGWSLWCAFALYPACRRRWTKALAALYPVVTLFCIVVTANHYFLDAVGGAAIFAAGALAARPLTTWMHRRLA